MGPPPPARRSSALRPRHFQPARGGLGRTRLETGEFPAVPASRRRTASVRLGDTGMVCGTCSRPALSPPHSAATVPSRLVRDYNITSVAPTYPELIISSSAPRQGTGVPSPCRSLLICQPSQVFPGQRRGEIRASVNAYRGLCLGTLAGLHEGPYITHNTDSENRGNTESFGLEKTFELIASNL